MSLDLNEKKKEKKLYFFGFSALFVCCGLRNCWFVTDLRDLRVVFGFDMGLCDWCGVVLFWEGLLWLFVLCDFWHFFLCFSGCFAGWLCRKNSVAQSCFLLMNFGLLWVFFFLLWLRVDCYIMKWFAGFWLGSLRLWNCLCDFFVCVEIVGSPSLLSRQVVFIERNLGHQGFDK